MAEAGYPDPMAFRTMVPAEFQWITRPHEPDEPARHVAELSETAGFAHTRANVWRYEPGAKGKRHRHPVQEETFVVISGTLSMYVGDPPERHDVPPGGIIHVTPRTPLQSVNHGDAELIVYAYGTPPESEHAELLESAL
jgi:quercetin dioxygenase-like cupin family protein